MSSNTNSNEPVSLTGDGTESLHYLTDLSRLELERLAANAPRGGYRAILADPPYRTFQEGKLGASQHYRLMGNDRILHLGQAVHALAAEDSFCFLWVTAATHEFGFQLLHEWGYRPASFFFWAKPRFTLGNTFRNAGELVLLGLKGHPKVAFHSQPNWGFYPLQDHSHKPEEFHQVVERLAGSGRYLELFARRPSPSSHFWDIWGNECDATVSLAQWGYPVPADDRLQIPAEYLERLERLQAAGQSGDQA